MGIKEVVLFLNNNLSKPLNVLITELNTSLVSKISTLSTQINTIKDLPSSDHGRVTFPYRSTSYTWTVPKGVTKIYVTACGGGGGVSYAESASSITYGQDGGTTTFGNLLTLGGGKKGLTTFDVVSGSSFGGEPGGTGGGRGGSSQNTAYDGISGKCGCGVNAGGGSLGGGGGSADGSADCLTPGGKCMIDITNADGGWGYETSCGTGGYGGGAGASFSNYNSGGGGGAAAVVKHELSVTPGTSYTITIGKGGSSANSSATGGNGIVIVEW